MMQPPSLLYAQEAKCLYQSNQPAKYACHTRSCVLLAGVVLTAIVQHYRPISITPVVIPLNAFPRIIISAGTPTVGEQCNNLSWYMQQLYNIPWNNSKNPHSAQVRTTQKKTI